MLNVLQIKEIHLTSIDFDCDWCQFIAISISNGGILMLKECKITKPGYEAFGIELGYRQVIEN